MKRSSFFKIALSGVSTFAGAYVIANYFKHSVDAEEPSKGILLDKDREFVSNWRYMQLDPDIAADLACENYSKGGCMFGIFSSILTLLGNKIGEPYTSFPLHMMKYGHGGVGGYGSLCGTLNGSAALIGLLIENIKNRDALIQDLFLWYETTELPIYKSRNTDQNTKTITSVSNSVLCHASTTQWSKVSKLKMNSEERRERCKCLTADVARKTVDILNDYFNGGYFTSDGPGETASLCLQCHGKESKQYYANGQMNCTSCHTTSLPHKVFSDIHYKMLKNVSK